MNRLLSLSLLQAAALAVSAQEIHEVTPMELGPLAEGLAKRVQKAKADEPPEGDGASD